MIQHDFILFFSVFMGSFIIFIVFVYNFNNIIKPSRSQIIIDKYRNWQIEQYRMNSDEVNYIKQFSNESGLTKYFLKMEQSYKNDINLAIYMNLRQVQKRNVFQIIQIDDNQNFVVNFYGFRTQLSDKNKQKLYKLFIKDMDDMLRVQTKRKYCLLFFNSSEDDGFDLLKNFYKKVPAIYFAKLLKIFVIQPGFILKSFGLINFTAWSRLFYRYISYINRVQEVQQISELKMYNILCKCPRQITRDIKLQCQNVPKNQAPQKIQKKQSAFDLLKRQFTEYEFDSQRQVPLILSILIETMKNDEQCCLIQGIFRIAGSIQDEQDILKYIIQVKTFRHLDSSEQCKRAISGVIKKIFTNSITPIISYEIYDKVIDTKIDENEIVDYWKIILKSMSTVNKRIFCYVIQFLKHHILDNKQFNKMTAHNLSVVFAPCFFRSKQACFSDFMNSGKFSALIKFLLEKYDSIFQQKGQNWFIIA